MPATIASGLPEGEGEGEGYGEGECEGENESESRGDCGSECEDEYESLLPEGVVESEYEGAVAFACKGVCTCEGKSESEHVVLPKLKVRMNLNVILNYRI